MKDFDLLPDQEKPQIEIPVIKKELKVAKASMFRGLKMWEVNMDTEECKLAELKITQLTTRNIVFEAQGVLSNPVMLHKVVYREGCYYTQALNKKNAMRHFYRATGRSSSGLKAVKTT